jgi:hypothetical protein
MNRDARPRAPYYAALSGEVWDDTTGPAEQMTGIERRRSARNIRLWRSYLPEDCVAAMVKMGWDRNT